MCAFLVDAPITFGHTQLKDCFEQEPLEEAAFAKAAKYIEKCIERIRMTFATLDLSEWAILADYTNTSGNYLKTLVLKASAKEEKKEYKVHLVPCFESHVHSANKLFLAQIHRTTGDSGGGAPILGGTA